MQEINFKNPNYKNNYSRNYYNTNSNVDKTPSKVIPPLIKGSDSPFKLHLTTSILDKIKYLCMEFPTKEWSGVLFWDFKGSLEDIKNLEVTAFDFYPLDLGSATYTEFSHSPKFAGYIAKHPELMDARMGLIHSHNNMTTFFSGTDTATLQEMSPEYGCYLSLIVNNAGTYSAALGVKATIKSVVKAETKSTVTYQGLDYQEVTIEKEPKIADETTEKVVVLRTDCVIHKEGKDFDNSEFIDSVNELKTNINNQSYKTRTSYFGNTNNVVTTDNTNSTVKDTLPFQGNSTKPVQGSLETIEFITRLISQSYFLKIANYKSFDENVELAMKIIPKDIKIEEYSTMVYEMIDPLMGFMNILKEDDQIQLLTSLVSRFESLKTKNIYYNEIYECLKSYGEQLLEDYIEGEEEFLDDNTNPITEPIIVK